LTAELGFNVVDEVGMREHVLFFDLDEEASLVEFSQFGFERIDSGNLDVFVDDTVGGAGFGTSGSEGRGAVGREEVGDAGVTELKEVVDDGSTLILTSI
jgi:hypothetical protein